MTQSVKCSDSNRCQEQSVVHVNMRASDSFGNTILTHVDRIGQSACELKLTCEDDSDTCRQNSNDRSFDIRVKWLQTLSAPISAQFYISYILLLICSNMFRCHCQPQGTDTFVVKMYSNNVLLYVLTTLV